MSNSRKERVLKELRQEVEKTRDEMNRKLDTLLDKIERAEKIELISVNKAAEILGITADAVRKRGDSGTLTKRNADGSRKITNRKTPVFYDEQEVRNKI